MTNDRETIQAQIEARLRRFGQTLDTLRVKTEQRRDKYDGTMKKSLTAIEAQHQKARERLQAMASLREDEWASAETEISGYLDDIDADLRQALAYYK